MYADELNGLLPSVRDAVETAGRILLVRFQQADLPDNFNALLAAIEGNDRAVGADLRAALLSLRPGSGWVEDEEAGGALPEGEWWIVDPVEGNVNHVHGGTGWAVSATLVRNGVPVLTAVHLPVQGLSYTAVQNGGTHVNGRRLHVSVKNELRAAILGTGQARPGEGRQIYAAIGRSVTAMLDQALLVRMAVPATLELIDVASGRMDGFWQFSQVRSGLAAGALLVSEAGGLLSDIQGKPWSFASTSFLAAAPGVHAAAVVALAQEVQP